MALDEEHLQYPSRHYGMDHDRYTWSQLSEREPIAWPGNACLALWVNVNLQFYPLDQQGKPFAVPGGMTMPYPDLRHFTLRDYGNRVGIFRLLKAFEHYSINPTYAINTELATRNRYLLDRVSENGCELICHGWNMDSLHYGGMGLDQEAELIDRSLSQLRQLSGQEISGWLSPARNESENTPELLKKHGVHYFCDWVNDDMPYAFRTDEGELLAMPLSNELDDYFVIMNNLHSEQSWFEQVCDACDFLLAEARRSGGRILALNIHPWILGQPHRIGKLEQALEYISGKEGIWNASASEIAAAWQQQTE